MGPLETLLSAEAVASAGEEEGERDAKPLREGEPLARLLTVLQKLPLLLPEGDGEGVPSPPAPAVGVLKIEAVPLPL